ncbi:MAG TPA: NAD(P)/FAD-dependent oxidoreductase [Sporichthya sp.]|nr:NAD(P)/FAD-dependent oxidoreductase [Sporichthya sp.]
MTTPLIAKPRSRRAPVRKHDVVVIGAGFAGLGAAIRLAQHGVGDVVILERGDRVGGTWRDNQYPGAACDIPSLLYSYSFAPKPDWPHAWSGSEEILGYIEDMVSRFELGPKLRFNSEVTSATFDESAGRWTVAVADGTRYSARAVVSASGPLANPGLPDIAGRDEFTGITMHSARWDHKVDLAGKRVAVIGTGASAVQIVPEIVEQAASVKVFQRTPGWVLPRPNLPQPGWLSSVYRHVPPAQSLAREVMFYGHEAVALALVWNTPATTVVERIAKLNLRRQVREPWLRRQLTPDFRPGCKRMLMTSDFYPALQKDNCKLITWPIQQIVADGIRTADGIEHHVDVIVFATGFEVSNAGTPFPVVGRDGRVLGEEWGSGAFAYKSVNVSGYPNLFFTFGPNSGPGHNSALVYMESQLTYTARAVKTILDRDLHSLDVWRDKQDAFNRGIQKRLGRTTWNSGCSSWYLTADGFNATMYPGFATQYRRQMAKLDLDDYEVRERAV